MRVRPAEPPSPPAALVMIWVRSLAGTLLPLASPEESRSVTPEVSKPSLLSWASTALEAPAKSVVSLACAATSRPSTSVIVLSEVLSDTERMSDSGAEETEATSRALPEAAARVGSPSTVIPASLRCLAKAWAASMAGSSG